VTITELIDRLQELKSIHGDLQVCVEDNSRPILFQEHWINKVEVYSDTGVFQDFKYCYIIMDDDSEYINEYLKKKGKKILPSKIVDL
jgi:hypothetical protein